MTTARLTTPLIALALALVSLSACEPKPQPAALDTITFDVTASRYNALAGEVVTFTADATNTLGRSSKVNWTTTGGTIERRADTALQIKFNDPGEYIISADLIVDGDRIRSDDAKVKITPVE